MIRFGIMGAGGIAAKFCEAVRLVQGVEVAAVASKSLERAQAFALANGVPAAYGNYEEMLSRQDIDVVYIATTCNFHYENCLQCLNFGKAVLCEKSLVETRAQALHLFEIAEQKKIFLMEAMWSRFLPTIQKAKEWIEQDRIGTVHIATYTGGIHAHPGHRVFATELGGGALLDLAVYPVEIVTYLVPQKLLNVQAEIISGPTGVDESNHILLQYETCRASLQCTLHARIPSPSGFYGTKGYIRMEKTHQAAVCELYDEQFQRIDCFESPVENGFEYEIAEVRDCLLRGDIESRIMPHAASLQCMEIFEQCRKKGVCHG